MRLVLARHGETTGTAERRFQGRTDVALSPRGRAQAEALGGALRGYRIAAAYVSPFRRARETAEVALAGTGVPVTPVEELRELSLGEWEGCTVDEVRAREGDPYRAWLLAPHDCPPPGGEPLDAVSARVRAAIDHISALHPNGDDVLVVAHGGVISVYACALLGCSFTALRPPPLAKPSASSWAPTSARRSPCSSSRSRSPTTPCCSSASVSPSRSSRGGAWSRTSARRSSAWGSSSSASRSFSREWRRCARTGWRSSWSRPWPGIR